MPKVNSRQNAHSSSDSSSSAYTPLIIEGSRRSLGGNNNLNLGLKLDNRICQIVREGGGRGGGERHSDKDRRQSDHAWPKFNSHRFGVEEF